jgi:hypothetical protein
MSQHNAHPSGQTLESYDQTAPQREQPSLSWQLILGLGGLALLFPLAEVTGVSGAVGEAPTALGILALVIAVWIITVGVTRVAHPVATLTLAGVVFGFALVAIPVVLGEHDGRSAVMLGVIAVFELGRSAALGALVGLAARGVQKILGRRR